MQIANRQEICSTFYCELRHIVTQWRCNISLGKLVGAHMRREDILLSRPKNYQSYQLNRMDAIGNAIG